MCVCASLFPFILVWFYLIFLLNRATFLYFPQYEQLYIQIIFVPFEYSRMIDGYWREIESLGKHTQADEQRDRLARLLKYL